MMSSDEERPDLTRIDDLSEFEHEDNTKVDRLLAKSSGTKKKKVPAADLEDLPEVPDEEDAPEDDDDEKIDDNTEPDAGPVPEESPASKALREEEKAAQELSGAEEKSPEVFQAQEEVVWKPEGEQAGNAESPPPSFGQTEVPSSTGQDFATPFASDTEKPEPEAPKAPTTTQIAETTAKIKNRPSAQTIDSFTSPFFDKKTNVEKTGQTSSQSYASFSGEKFQDVSDFAKNLNYGDIKEGGNPPFSIIIRNIKFVEDGDAILEILQEHKIATDANIADFKKGISQGAVIIPHISEYSAIYLAHKFRRFDIDLLMGPSEELHPTQNYSSEKKGLVSKDSWNHNRLESIDLTKLPEKAWQVILTTLPSMEGFSIVRYLGIITEHRIISEKELKDGQSFIISDEIDHEVKKDIPSLQEVENMAQDAKFAVLDGAPALPTSKVEEVYSRLAQSLKEKALKLKGNAVVGVNFQISPLPPISSENNLPTYKITATGNAVWVAQHGSE